MTLFRGGGCHLHLKMIKILYNNNNNNKNTLQKSSYPLYVHFRSSGMRFYKDGCYRR